MSRLSRRRSRILAAAVAVLVAFAVAVFVGATSGSRTSTSSRLSTLPFGAVAPAWSGTTLTGARLSSTGERGHWVVLNFFATWCTACQQETPQLRAFVSRTPTAKVQVISVLDTDTAANARRFVVAHRVNWPIITDPSGTLKNRFYAYGLPETFVIDPEGRLAYAFTGAATGSELDGVVTGRIS